MSNFFCFYTGWVDKQMDERTDRQTDGLTYKQTNVLKDSWVEKKIK